MGRNIGEKEFVRALEVRDTLFGDLFCLILKEKRSRGVPQSEVREDRAEVSAPPEAKVSKVHDL